MYIEGKGKGRKGKGKKRLKGREAKGMTEAVREGK